MSCVGVRRLVRALTCGRVCEPKRAVLEPENVGEEAANLSAPGGVKWRCRGLTSVVCEDTARRRRCLAPRAPRRGLAAARHEVEVRAETGQASRGEQEERRRAEQRSAAGKQRPERKRRAEEDGGVLVGEGEADGEGAGAGAADGAASVEAEEGEEHRRAEQVVERKHLVCRDVLGVVLGVSQWISGDLECFLDVVSSRAISRDLV